MICNLEEKHLPELSKFLQEGLGSGRDSWFTVPVLRWKYLGHSKDLLAEPRSFICLKENEIVAHIGLTFNTILNSDGSAVRVMHPIDWYAKPGNPSAGLSVMLKALEHSEVQYVIGGTPEANKIQLKLGFEDRESVWQMRCTLRPSYHFRYAGAGLIKSTLKYLRDSLIIAASYLKTPAYRLGVRLTTNLLQAEGSPTREEYFSDSDREEVEKYLKYPYGDIYWIKVYSGDSLLGYALIRVTKLGHARQATIGLMRLREESLRLRRCLIVSLVRWLYELGIDQTQTFTSDDEWRRVLIWFGFRVHNHKTLVIRDSNSTLRGKAFPVSPSNADHMIR